MDLRSRQTLCCSVVRVCCWFSATYLSLVLSGSGKQKSCFIGTLSLKQYIEIIPDQRANESHFCDIDVESHLEKQVSLVAAF